MGFRRAARALGMGAWFLLFPASFAAPSLVAEAAAGQWWVRVLVVESSPVVNLGGPRGVYAWDLATRGYVAAPGPGKALNLRGCCPGQVTLADGRLAGPLGARSMDGSPVAVNGEQGATAILSIESNESSWCRSMAASRPTPGCRKD